MITQGQFIAGYAQRSNISVLEANELLVAIPASMDWPESSEVNCEGWHMLSRGFAEEHLRWCVEQGLVSEQALSYLSRASAKA